MRAGSPDRRSPACPASAGLRPCCCTEGPRGLGSRTHGPWPALPAPSCTPLPRHRTSCAGTPRCRPSGAARTAPARSAAAPPDASRACFYLLQRPDAAAPPRRSSPPQRRCPSACSAAPAAVAAPPGTTPCRADCCCEARAGAELYPGHLALPPLLGAACGCPGRPSCGGWTLQRRAARTRRRRAAPCRCCSLAGLQRRTQTRLVLVVRAWGRRARPMQAALWSQAGQHGWPRKPHCCCCCCCCCCRGRRGPGPPQLAQGQGQARGGLAAGRSPGRRRRVPWTQRQAQLWPVRAGACGRHKSCAAACDAAALPAAACRPGGSAPPWVCPRRRPRCLRCRQRR
mmetsp:Transcript_31307/g.79103  ORF Transcript_31307/g.79103 Transcript_31307/m.79103 type:complete len:342 (-) Transcript_31307:514-1539(-)